MAGTTAPPIADRVIPGPGQESVWEYPRPPRVEAVPERLRVVINGVTVADTTLGQRVLETAGAPVYYFPPVDVRMDLLARGDRTSTCEWKGEAIYYHAAGAGQPRANVAWSYPDPNPGYEAIRDYLAFYASRVGDERARPQPGGFYGGWVTSRIVGPIKGEPGSEGW